MAQDALSDGYVRLCIDPSLNVFAEGCKILVEGQMTAAGDATPNAIVCVNSTTDLAKMFGQGSILTESLRKVFCQCPNKLSVYALPRLDAAGSVAAQYTLTVGGDPTTDGRMQLFLGDGVYTIDIGVDVGETPVDIAAAIVAALSEDFPYTAEVGEDADANVITFTARNAGTIGNHLTVIFSNLGSCASIVPEGVTLAFAQTVTGTGSPAPTDYGTVVNECCFAVYALMADSEAWQTNLRNWIRSAWDCDKPQCFGHGYVFNRGTVGQILADGDNSAELSRVAIPVNYPVFPFFTVAAYAALSGCTACDAPELNIQGPTNGLLSCITMPETCTPGFSYPEVVQLQNAGFVVTGPATSSGQGSFTSPFVYNDVTNYQRDDKNRPNATFRDASSRRLAAVTASEIAVELQKYNGLSLFTKNTNIKEGVKGTNVRLMLAGFRKWASDNVGIRFSEFDNINEDIRLYTDFQVKPQCVGEPGVLHLFMKYRPPVRISRVNTYLQPALFDNCPR